MFWEGCGEVTAGAPGLGWVEGILVAFCPTKPGVSPKAPQLGGQLEPGDTQLQQERGI